MKRLKSRQGRIDQLRSEGRPRKRGRIGRYVYLATLGALAFFLFDQFAGELVYLKADGMVTRDVAVVAAEYDGMVQEIPISEGAPVSAGDAIALLRSTDVLRDMAALSNELARVRSSLSEMRVRQAKVEALLPVARERADAMKGFREQLASLKSRGLSTSTQLTSVIDDAFEALEKVQELEAEKEIVGEELAQTEATVRHARSALNELKWLYDDGVVRAQRDGVVGTVHVEPGAGVTKGQRLAEVFYGSRYILAYVPTGALYDIEPGQAVAVRTGFATFPGRVQETVKIARRLPSEFQRTFGTVDRKQLVRIRLQALESNLPLFTTVSVTRPNAFRPLAIRAMAAAGDALDALFHHGVRVVRTGWQEAKALAS